MNKKLLFSLTTIALLLFSSISFSQTLELGTLSDFSAFSGTGGVANEGLMYGNAGTYNGIISGSGFGPAYTSAGYTTYRSFSDMSTQAQKDVLRVYIHLSDVFVTQSDTHSSVFGSGETIFPGVYSIPGAGNINGALTLDGNGNSDSVFILKFEGALTVGASATIALSNGTKAANVYWISEGAITLGANSVVRGSVFAHPGGITVGTNGTVEGRLITSEGAITVGAGASLVIPVGPSDIQINCLGTCDSNSVADVLGSVKSFAMFTSFGAVSNAGTSGFIGDIGSNGGAVTGIQTGATTHIGHRYIPGTETAQAAQDLSSAYNQLMAIQNTVNGHIPTFGNGETMQPGVYYIEGAGSLQGTIVLDANFDPDAVFIFKFLGAFTVYAQSKIILKNGARRCNIFWVSGAGGTGAIDIGTFAFVKGTFLAHGGACTAAANVNLEGRMLSTAGAIGFSTGVIYNDTLCFEEEIAIIKTGLFVDANDDQCADVGETIDYTFTVTNEGLESLSAIVVTDPLVPIIAYESGDTNGDSLLDLTETWIYKGTFTIDQDDIDAGRVINQALARATTYNGLAEFDLSHPYSVLEDDPTITELCNLRLVVEKIDILCNGFNTGSITVSATGGLPPYMFTLNGGIPQSSPLFDNLLAGVYTIGITDTTPGNSNSIVVSLVEPEALSIVITKVNATTGQGCLDGQATATVSGGTPPYTYQWSA
ncbi:MAG: putative repeat protein (TIGR01451 family), partial [bacterium]